MGWDVSLLLLAVGRATGFEMMSHDHEVLQKGGGHARWRCLSAWDCDSEEHGVLLVGVWIL